MIAGITNGNIIILIEGYFNFIDFLNFWLCDYKFLWYNCITCNNQMHFWFLNDGLLSHDMINMGGPRTDFLRTHFFPKVRFPNSILKDYVFFIVIENK